MIVPEALVVVDLRAQKPLFDESFDFLLQSKVVLCHVFVVSMKITVLAFVIDIR